MMFLLRSAFWISVVILLVPVDDEAVGRTSDVAPPIGAFEAVAAAQTTLADMNGFCGRNPDVCDIGGRIATTFALKARTGAEMLVEFVDARIGPAEPATDPAVDHGTLTPADLSPAWQGPDPAKAT